MKVLDLELKKFDIELDNILNSHGKEKLLIIIADLKLKNDNGKCMGKIIGLINPKKKYLILNQIVEFYEKNIKWSCTRHVNNNGLYIISDFWVKPFIHESKIDVPIKVLDQDTNKEITIMRKLTYKQFQENRLLDFYGRYTYRLVSAYKNFNDLFKNHDYWYCINATVRNYRVDKEHLRAFLGMVDTQKKQIKHEWLRYMQYDWQQNQTNLKIQNLIDRYNSTQSENVFQFKT